MVDVSPLSQMDPRWKNKPLGFDSISIGNYGCLMTCMTMVANFYGFNETPDTVNEKMKAVKGFQGALIIPAAFPAALPGMVYRNFINCENSPAPMVEIDAYLAQGKPVIVEVDYAPNPGLQNHWIVLYEKRGSDYLLRDPWPFPVVTNEGTLLTSRYKFGGSPAQIVKGVVFLEGSKVSVQKPKVSLDKGVKASFPVYATADGLALRSDTVVADYTLIKRVPIGAKLTVLEADQMAKPKIGVLNQWIPVLDPSDGTQGFTAAWYVSLTATGGGPVAPPLAAPQPAKPQNLIVKTIDEGVALRSKPEISDASLARRVPVNTQLICTETYDAAAAKVGVVYQWLKVKDVTNCEYYVAAWYVQAVNGLATLGVKNQGAVNFGIEDAAPEPLIARAGVEGLAMRSLPLIMNETLIKRLPIDGELIALEDPLSAEGKLGNMGEWLHVRDVEGDEGYVAAWYAVKRPDPVIDEMKPILG